MKKSWKLRVVKTVFKDEQDYLTKYLIGRLPYWWTARKFRRAYGFRMPELPKQYEQQIKEFWKERLGIRIQTTGYRYFYAANRTENAYYIPQDIFQQYIVKHLNKFEFAPVYADKNMYDNLFPGVKTPRTILRNFRGKFYDGNYNFLENKIALEKIMDALNSERLLFKPSLDSGGGKGIFVLSNGDLPKRKSDSKSAIREILTRQGQDYLVQCFVKQHEILDSVYPFSLNTMRIITFETDGQIEILASVLKMGNNSCHLDKVSMGGLSCGILNSGRLNKYAFTSDIENPLIAHPQTGTEFGKTVIPNFKEVKAFVIRLHGRLSPYFRLVSWDVALAESGEPILIEANLRNHQGVMIPQLNCGPLFGNKTEKVLSEICAKDQDKRS